MARGTLRIYLGAAPGVGKTYAMLGEGRRRQQRGTDVVVGLVETYGRPMTEAQVRGLEVVPRAKIEYRGQMLEEMDLDAILERRPAVVLVDELAHTNVPGSRHTKRWEDIAELLDAGINVISTLNIQHLESVNDVVQRITGIEQRETVPDAIVRAADQIELVDMTPEALRRRMAHGNVYTPDKLDAALANYFRVGNLAALRELALLWVAGKVDQELATYRARHRIDAAWETKERVVVALTGAPGGDDMLRRAARMAARVNGELIGVHVRVSDGFARPDGGDPLDAQRQLLGDLNGRYAEVTGSDIGRALVQFARAENASQLVLGASARSRWSEFVSGSVVTRVVHEAAPMDVHVISPQTPHRGLPDGTARRRLTAVPARRRNLGWVLGTVGIAAVGFALLPLRSSFSLPGALLCLLAAIVVIAAVGGALPALAATVIAALIGDVLFTRPYGSFRVDRAADVIALIVFFAVAASVSALVDRLARRGVQVTRAAAEAEALARLAGRSVQSGGDALPDLVAELRRVFDLDGVGILEPDGAGWRLLAKAGAPVAERPEDAAFRAELDQGALLVLSGDALSADDTRLLNAFVAQLREAQRRARLESEAASATQLAEADSIRTALLAAVSHDLRTPLAAIKAAATSLLSDEVGWGRAEVRDFAETIDEESDRLTGLVSNLLDMSRLQTGVLPVSSQATDVEYVIFSAVAGLPSSGAGLDIQVDENLPLALVDPGLLQQALANVVENAQKWSPADAPVRVEASSVGDRVTIRVVDRGPGIPEDQQQTVFLPFQRLGDAGAEQPKGVGLGLAVAQGFVEAMDGELTVEDTPGGGATLVFRLIRADS